MYINFLLFRIFIFKELIMEINKTEQKQVWQAPDLKVVDVAESTLAGTGVGDDGLGDGTGTGS